MRFLPLVILLVGCAVQPIGRDGPFSPVFVEEYWECTTRDGGEEIYSCAEGTGPPYFDPNVTSCEVITSDTTGRRPRDCNCCE